MADEHPFAERRALLEQGAAHFEELVALLDAKQEEASLHAEGASDWSSRDVYAHFARWTGFTIEQVQRKAAGLDWLPPLAGTDDEINERWAAEDRALSTEDARDWCIAATETLRRLLGDLSADQWRRFGRKCVEDVGGDHYRAHIKFIKAGAGAG